MAGRRDSVAKYRGLRMTWDECDRWQHGEAFARPFADMLERIDERDQLRLLLDVNNLVLSKLPYGEFLGALSAAIQPVVRHEHLNVAVYDRGAGELRVPATYAAGRGITRVNARLPLDRSPEGVTLQRGLASVFHPEDLELLGALSPASDASMFCLPLLTGRGLLGVLNITTASDVLTDRAMELLVQASTPIAAATENALAEDASVNNGDRPGDHDHPIDSEIRLEREFGQIVGKSEALRRVMRAVKTVAPTDATVMLLGETGTGKELFARAIHRMSSRSARTFVRLSGAALPSGLLESELFGYEKGAFTGATSSRIGRVELAHRGTLFLDEVGDIPLDVQPKLLRVLQEREFERLGSTQTRYADVRIISATNRELDRMVDEELFRSDLYYRLSVFPIQIPALRDRAEDIPLLAHYFTDRFARRLRRPVPRIPHDVLEAFRQWRWPGNVRELENVIERAVILSPGAELQVPLRDFLPKERKGTRKTPTLHDIERENILRALRASRGVVGGPTGAASRLGLKRTTLQSLMRRLGIQKPEY
jgi:formate hydrogenlyase transcriptional activator